ncbi:hypothetical protein phiBZS1_p74 [Serratia phage vB_SspM_BZS1]|nr:hypothetical protein phiBZS1_p74 [Serratia phage vB_SspM_BZS1]
MRWRAWVIMGRKAPTPCSYTYEEMIQLRPAPPPPPLPPKAYATPSQDPTTAHCHSRDVILPGDEVTYLVRFKKV